LSRAAAAEIKGDAVTLHDTQLALAAAARPASPRDVSATFAEGEAREPAPPKARGAALGRYVTLSVLGAGAMGLVYAAFDPELERKIALKVLRRGAASADHRERLMREARTLAKLGHPNVVAIHDIGVVDDELFVAMEYVAGQTLAAWLRERPRSVQEILGVFMAAGRGLAAAHRANIVHRDFKPENTMVGVDGRVRVLDFGLARDAEASHDSLIGETLVSGSTSTTDMRLTREGALLGTPAYMAPEQWQGGAATPRSDQFAFAVALWEALYGQRPFRGETTMGLMSAVLAGTIDAAVPAGRRVPAYLRRVLERGLAAAPERRFAGMDELLAAIERGQAGQRRRTLWFGLAAVGLLAGGVYGLRAQKIAACEAAGEAITEVWGEAARERLRGAVRASGVGYAESSYPRATARIDAWVDDWRELRAQACREATVEGSRAPELYERAAECLDARREELAGLLAVYAAPTAADIEELVPAAAALPPLDPCVERSALVRRPPLPGDPAARRRVEALRRELVRLDGLRRAGRGDVLPQVEALAAEIEAAGYPLLAVEWRYLLGSLAARPGSFDRAETELAEVYREAGSIGADEVAAAAAVQLVKIVGVDRARAAQGSQWALSADVLVARLGQERGLLGADLLGNRALVARAQGRYDESIALQGRALALREELLGPTHPIVAMTLNHLANAARDRGDFAAALAALQRALAIRKEALGPDHPAVGGTLNNLGLLELARGNYAAAQGYLEQGLAIVEVASGPSSLETATLLGNLGRAHHLRGDYEAAQALLERALAIREVRLGPQDLDVAASLQNLALLYMVRGERVRARALFERVLAIREKRLEESNPEVLAALDNLGTVDLRLGELDAARSLHERALAQQRAQRGPKHVSVAHSLRNLALVHLARGESQQALALAEEARAIGEAALGPEHPDVAVFLNTLGAAQRSSDRAAAEASLSRALAISRRTRGDHHPGTALSLQRLGEVLTDRGAYSEAQARLEQALAIRAEIAANGPEVADVLFDLGALELARGRVEAAVPRFTRAVEIREAGEAAGHELAEARFGLARALRRTGERTRSQRLAEQASAGYAAAGAGFEDRRAAVDAWLSAE
jgi:tetratricopeptide (TPR) repeat protein/predicted Ser/Thr protein kinase